MTTKLLSRHLIKDNDVSKLNKIAGAAKINGTGSPHIRANF